MISPKRMVEIFRSRGGGKDFISPADRLSSEEFAYLKGLAEGEPLVAKLSSDGEWLVLTNSHLVIGQSAKVLRCPLEEICSVNIPQVDVMNARIKVEGGSLDLGLLNGASLRVKVEPGGPYFGLMNVSMRIATTNRRRNSKVRTGDDARPTTNDKRPTTVL